MGCILLPAIPKQSGVASFALLKTNSFKRTGGHAVKSWATCYNSRVREMLAYCTMVTLSLDCTSILTRFVGRYLKGSFHLCFLDYHSSETKHKIYRSFNLIAVFI